MKKRSFVFILSILVLLLCTSACKRFKVFEEVVPVERIEITNEGLDHSDSFGDYVVINPDEQFRILYHVYPENATNTKVSFSYQAQPEGCATVDEDGVVKFSSEGMIKVFVIAADGGDAQDTITIVAKN